MPEKETVKRAKAKLRQGKAPTTAAGELVHEEIEHVRGGKHGARSPQQAIAIGLSKARRAGVPLPPPKKGKRRGPSKRRRQGTRGVLKRERQGTASKRALSSQARRAAARRKAQGGRPKRSSRTKK